MRRRSRGDSEAALCLRCDHTQRHEPAPTGAARKDGRPWVCWEPDCSCIGFQPRLKPPSLWYDYRTT